MVPIEMDVITLIIDHVDDRGTLFSLLTVNKDFFGFTSRVLYRDPFRFFCYKEPYGYNILTGMRSLIRLLLGLSSATDDHTNTVREAFALERKVEQPEKVQPTTMLDYLSFIQHIRWDKGAFGLISQISMDVELLVKHASQHGFHSHTSFLRRTLTWSICGHRLGDIRGLEIDPDDIARFTDLASHLCRLSYVFFVMPYNQSYYPLALRLVQALQERHGKNQLLDVRFADHDVVVMRHNDVSHWTVEITQLLPPLFPRGLSLALPLRPMDGPLSRLTYLTITQASKWVEILKDYSDLSIGQFLQRCRSLTSLDLDFSVPQLQDANMFAWAAYEARDRAAGKLRSPQVPLSRLALKMSGPCAIDGRRLLMDAAQGFSCSLQSIHFRFDPPEGDYNGGDLPRLDTSENERIVLPKLHVLGIRSPDPRVFDGRLLRFCPSLMSLNISLDERKDSNVQLPSWPVVHLPCPGNLTLNGHAVDLFDPASLSHAPELQVMSLNGTFSNRQTSRDEARRLERWTWDWDFAELIELVMTGFSKTTFSLKVLRHCPKLQYLSVEFPSNPNEPPFPLDVSSILTNPTQDVFPNLQSLWLSGNYSLQEEDFKDLMARALPELDSLSLGLEYKCTIQQMIECTRDHAWLREATFQHALLSTKELEQLGLEDEPFRAEYTGWCRYWLKNKDATVMVCRLRDFRRKRGSLNSPVATTVTTT